MEPFAIEALHHVAVSVTDMVRARWFYGEVLGLKEIPRAPFDFDGAWYQLGERTLHLIVHPPTRTLRGTRDIGPREGHFAIRVKNYHESLAHLRAHGIECLEVPENPTPWAQFYVTDPDGNILEFNVERQSFLADR